MLAEAAAQTWTPPVIAPAPEMDALLPFFFDCTWVGKVYANMQGPSSPEMDVVGGATLQPLMDGLWLVMDCWQDQLYQGKKLLTWKLHLVIGWDGAAREYRAILADSNGVSALLRGEIVGAELVMTPIGLAPGAGQMAALRFVWDATDPGAVLWRNEASIDGSPWMLIEDYVMTPVARNER